MSLKKSLVMYAYVPVVLIGALAAAYAIVANGHSYVWLAPVLAAAYLAAFAAEKIAPFFGEWTEHDAHGDTKTNIWHTIAYESSALSAFTFIPIITWLFPFQGIWPTNWPLWGQWLLAVLAADFAFTMVHYFSHRVPSLWRLHAVHHGVGRLYGFNGVARHPLHQSLDTIIGTAPLIVIGMPVPVAVLLGFSISVFLVIQHSNVDAKLGPFEGVLSIGRLHHLHHVNWGTEGDCNFGLFLTFWDRVLGTYNPTPSREITSADMGLDEVPNFPKSYWEQLMFPFVYKPGQGEPERYKAAKHTPTPAQDARSQIMDAAE